LQAEPKNLEFNKNRINVEAAKRMVSANLDVAEVDVKIWDDK